MDSIRQKQVGELIRREMSSVLLQEGRYIYGDSLVTITNVKVAPDLSEAKVYFSIYNTEDKYETFEALGNGFSRVRNALFVKLKKQLRRVPVFDLFLDETLDEVDKIEKIFNKIQEDEIPPLL